MKLNISDFYQPTPGYAGSTLVATLNLQDQYDNSINSTRALNVTISPPQALTISPTDLFFKGTSAVVSIVAYVATTGATLTFTCGNDPVSNSLSVTSDPFDILGTCRRSCFCSCCCRELTD